MNYLEIKKYVTLANLNENSLTFGRLEQDLLPIKDQKKVQKFIFDISKILPLQKIKFKMINYTQNYSMIRLDSGDWVKGGFKDNKFLLMMFDKRYQAKGFWFVKFNYHKEDLIKLTKKIKNLLK
jgi:hypothetical protein